MAEPRSAPPPRRQRRALLLAALLAATVAAGCGSDGDASADEAAQPQVRVLHGETESGMTLEVELPADPDADPRLAELDAYREAIGAQPVDYIRVTADNSAGTRAESGRTLTLARDADALSLEGGIQARFSCDALEFEWPPPRGDHELASARGELLTELCEHGPPARDGIAAGQSLTYYLFVDRTIETRRLDELSVFGPRNAELSQAP